MDSSEISAALHRAAKAQSSWATTERGERAAILTRAAVALRARRQSLALLITREMGKPITESLAEIDKCATTIDYYAKNGAAFLAEERCGTDADQSWVSYEPGGVVLAIMPWNYPLWQVFRFAAPAPMRETPYC